MPRSVARADVAELSAALGSHVEEEGDHHLVIVSTNKVLSTTQFKQMFYSRGDDFFQIANCYECPDSTNSIRSSVWGVDASMDNVNSYLVSTGAQDLSGTTGHHCYNFNKLGGRQNDPSGVVWAYSYVHDMSRNFYAQHEVMGYLEKDTCIKRDFWTTCSRMSIEDQLYGLAFASETDQDLCMKVTCARRWSEVEDALSEACLTATSDITPTVKLVVVKDDVKHATNKFKYINHGLDTGDKIKYKKGTDDGAVVTDLAFDQDYYVIRKDNNHFEVASTEDDAKNGTKVTFQGTGHDEQYFEYTPSALYKQYVDLYINVRVSNGHPEALDTILRIRFTVHFGKFTPVGRHTWNTRASTAASGVIRDGVAGDAPEGGEDPQGGSKF